VLLLAVSCGPSKVRFPAVYIDMDGTLLGPDNKVRPASVKAIKRYQACGGRVGIATGRTFDQIKPYMSEIQPTMPAVLFNGAVLMSPDGSRTLVVHRLNASVVREVLPVVGKFDGVLGVLVHEEFNTIVDRESKSLREGLATGHIYPNRVIEDLAGEYRGEPVKILLVVEEGRVVEVRDKVLPLVGDKARAVISSNFTVEILPLDVNKADTITFAMEINDFHPRDVLVFGDSGNDVEMVSQLGPGFAMGNCRPECCEAALVRLDANDTDIIGKVIDKLACTPHCPLLEDSE